MKGYKNWPTRAEGYEIVSGIGKGRFGMIWKVKVIEGSASGSFAAMKNIDLEQCNDHKIDEIRKKILLFNSINCPHVLTYIMAFISGKKLWIIFELMDLGSVEGILQAYYPEGFKDMRVIATIMKEILMGLSYLHENKKINRDVRAGHILVNKEGHVRLSDLGLCAKLKKKKRTSCVGSPCWMAPEVLNNSTDGYDEKADIWSIGITAFELAYGKPPLSEYTTMKAILKIINEEPPRLKVTDGWDDSFAEFISFCLQKNPNDRKTSDFLLKCKFISKAQDKMVLKDIFKDVPILEQRLPQSLAIQAQEEIKCLTKNKKTTNNDSPWDFSIEESTDLPQLELKPFYSEVVSDKTHIEEVLKERVEFKKRMSMMMTPENSSRAEAKGIQLLRSNSENFSSLGNRNSPATKKICQTPKIQGSTGDFFEFHNLEEEEEV